MPDERLSLKGLYQNTPRPTSRIPEPRIPKSPTLTDSEPKPIVIPKAKKTNVATPATPPLATPIEPVDTRPSLAGLYNAPRQATPETPLDTDADPRISLAGLHQEEPVTPRVDLPGSVTDARRVLASDQPEDEPTRSQQVIEGLIGADESETPSVLQRTKLDFKEIKPQDETQPLQDDFTQVQDQTGKVGIAERFGRTSESLGEDALSKTLTWSEKINPVSAARHRIASSNAEKFGEKDRGEAEVQKLSNMELFTQLSIGGHFQEKDANNAAWNLFSGNKDARARAEDALIHRSRKSVRTRKSWEQEREERGETLLSKGAAGAVDMVPYMAAISAGVVPFIAAEGTVRFVELRNGKAQLNEDGSIELNKEGAEMAEAIAKAYGGAAASFYIEKIAGKTFKRGAGYVGGKLLGKVKVPKGKFAGLKAIGKKALKIKGGADKVLKPLNQATGVGGLFEEVIVEEGLEALNDAVFNLSNDFDEGVFNPNYKGKYEGLQNLGTAAKDFYKAIPEITASMMLMRGGQYAATSPLASHQAYKQGKARKARYEQILKARDLNKKHGTTFSETLDELYPAEDRDPAIEQIAEQVDSGEITKEEGETLIDANQKAIAESRAASQMLDDVSNYQTDRLNKKTLVIEELENPPPEIAALMDAVNNGEMTIEQAHETLNNDIMDRAQASIDEQQGVEEEIPVETSAVESESIATGVDLSNNLDPAVAAQAIADRESGAILTDATAEADKAVIDALADPESRHISPETADTQQRSEALKTSNEATLKRLQKKADRQKEKRELTAQGKAQVAKFNKRFGQRLTPAQKKAQAQRDQDQKIKDLADIPSIEEVTPATPDVEQTTEELRTPSETIPTESEMDADKAPSPVVLDAGAEAELQLPPELQESLQNPDLNDFEINRLAIDNNTTFEALQPQYEAIHEQGAKSDLQEQARELGIKSPSSMGTPTLQKAIEAEQAKIEEAKQAKKKKSLTARIKSKLKRQDKQELGARTLRQTILDDYGGLSVDDPNVPEAFFGMRRKGGANIDQIAQDLADDETFSGFNLDGSTSGLIEQLENERIGSRVGKISEQEHFDNLQSQAEGKAREESLQRQAEKDAEDAGDTSFDFGENIAEVKKPTKRVPKPRKPKAKLIKLVDAPIDHQQDMRDVIKPKPEHEWKLENVSVADLWENSMASMLEDTDREGFNMDAFVQDVQKNGVTAPIAMYRNADGTIEAEGQHRIFAARQTGMKTIPAYVLQTDDKATPISPKDTTTELKTKGKVDPEGKAISKDPWQMTRDEFVGDSDGDEKQIRLTAHANHVKTAVSEGKSVPVDVLESYRNNGWAAKAIRGKSATKKRVPAPRIKPIDRLSSKIKKEHGAQLDILNLNEGDDYIQLHDIRVAETDRGTGVGSKTIQSITDYADSVGKPVVLSAQPEARKKGALESFYKGHGFKRPGRNKDFSLPRHTHVYTPKTEAKFMLEDTTASEIKEMSVDPENVPVKGWAGRTMFHGAESSSVKDIQKNGLDMSKSTKGYFGRGFYMASDADLAQEAYADFAETEDDAGDVIAVKIKDDANILDLRDPADDKTYMRVSKNGSILSNDNIDKIMVRNGIDGIFDRSFGGVVIYNPDAVETVGSRSELRFLTDDANPAQTETKAFKKWFGNSAVVDKDDNPLVVYHGTGSQFTIFDQKAGGKVTQARSAKKAFFFTADKATAEAYSIYASEDAMVQSELRKADRAEKRGDWDSYDKHLIEAERLDTPTQRSRLRQENARVIDAYLKSENIVTVDAENKTPQELSDDSDIDSWLTEQIKLAKADKKDGILIKNLDDAVGLYNQPADHYIVFDPSQIKSATDNIGTFDQQNPDIRFSTEDQKVQKPLAKDQQTLIQGETDEQRKQKPDTDQAGRRGALQLHDAERDALHVRARRERALGRFQSSVSGRRSTEPIRKRFENVELDQDAYATPEAQRLEKRANSLGYNILYVKNVQGVAGFMDPYSKSIIINTESSKEGEQVYSHEEFHAFAIRKGRFTEYMIDAIDQSSEAFKEYADILRQQPDLEKLTDRQVAEEMAANIYAGIMEHYQVFQADALLKGTKVENAIFEINRLIDAEANKQTQARAPPQKVAPAVRKGVPQPRIAKKARQQTLGLETGDQLGLKFSIDKESPYANEKREDKETLKEDETRTEFPIRKFSEAERAKRVGLRYTRVNSDDSQVMSTFLPRDDDRLVALSKRRQNSVLKTLDAISAYNEKVDNDLYDYGEIYTDSELPYIGFRNAAEAGKFIPSRIETHNLKFIEELDAIDPKLATELLSTAFQKPYRQTEASATIAKNQGYGGLSEDIAGFKGQDGDQLGLKFSTEDNQVGTKAFEKWFGDSKVVDADGNPLVVYHGTGADFTEFDKKTIGKNYRESERTGFFFTQKENQAKNYAKLHSKDGKGTVIPAYISIQNPLTISSKGETITPSYEADLRGSEHVLEAENTGKDGVIILGANGDNLYIAVKPTQIKSATENTGTFSSTNPDIRFLLEESPLAPKSILRLKRGKKARATARRKEMQNYLAQIERNRRRLEADPLQAEVTETERVQKAVNLTQAIERRQAETKAKQVAEKTKTKRKSEAAERRRKMTQTRKDIRAGEKEKFEERNEKLQKKATDRLAEIGVEKPAKSAPAQISQAFKKGQRETKMEFKALIRDEKAKMIDRIKSARKYIEEGLKASPEEKGKFLASLEQIAKSTPQAAEKKMNQIAERISKIEDRVAHKKAKTSLMKTIQKINKFGISKFSKDRKITVEGLLGEINTKKMKENEAINNAIQEVKDSGTLTAEESQKLTSMIVRNISDLSTEEMDYMNYWLNLALKEQKQASIALDKERTAKAKNDARGGILNIEAGNPDVDFDSTKVSDIHPLNARQALFGTPKDLAYISDIAEDNGPIYKSLVSPYKDAARRESQVMADVQKFLESDEGLGVDFDHAKYDAPRTARQRNASEKKGYLKEYDLESGEKIELTDGQRLSIYRYSLSPGGMSHMTSERGGIIQPWSTDTKTATKLTEDDVARIAYDVSQDAELMEIHTAVAHVIDNILTPAINQTSNQIDGYEKATEEDYLMLQVSSNHRMRSMDFDSTDPAAMQRINQLALNSLNNLKPRLPGASSPIVLHDIFDLMRRSTKVARVYHGYAEPVDMIKRMLGPVTDRQGNTLGSLETTITRAYGKPLWKSLIGLTRQFEEAEAPRVGENFWNSALRMQTGGIFAFNIPIFSIQPLSYIGALANMPPKHWAWSARRAPAEYSEMGKYSGVLYLRGKGRVSIATDYLAGPKGQAGSVARIGQKGMIAGDRQAIGRIWNGYKHMVQEAFPNASEDEIGRKTARLTEEEIWDTQPSSDAVGRSAAQRSKSVVAKGLMRFTSQRVKYQSLAFRAMYGLAKGTVAPKDALFTLFILAMAGAAFGINKAFWAAIYKRWGSEKGLVKNAAQQTLSANTSLIGRDAEIAKDLALSPFGVTDPVLTMVGDVATQSKRLIKGTADRDYEKMFKAFYKLQRSTGGMGTGLHNLVEPIKAAYQWSTSGDIGEDLGATILGEDSFNARIPKPRKK